MNKTLIGSLALVVLIPQFALAAWWNPLSWFAKADQPSVVSQPVQETDVNLAATTTINNSDSETKPAQSDQEVLKLRSELSSLNTENTSLRNQLADAQDQYRTCSESLTGAQNSTSQQNADDQKASDIRVALAKLDKIDLQIDTLSDDDLVDVLNTAQTMDRTSLFGRPPRSEYSYWRTIDLSKVTIDWLHAVVDTYRSELKIDLAQYQ